MAAVCKFNSFQFHSSYKTMWMCVNWLYKGESLNCKGYTVNHVNVLCSSSMKFWCWKSAFSSCVAQAPSAMEAWEWGADDDGRWRWLPWHGPGSDGGSGLSVTKHNNCRANRVANRRNERDRLRANCEAKDEVIQDLEKSWRTSQPTARPRTSRTSEKSWRTSQPTARPRTTSSRTSKKAGGPARKDCGAGPTGAKDPRADEGATGVPLAAAMAPFSAGAAGCGRAAAEKAETDHGGPRADFQFGILVSK